MVLLAIISSTASTCRAAFMLRSTQKNMAQTVAPGTGHDRGDSDALLATGLVQPVQAQSITPGQYPVAHTTLTRGHQLPLESGKLGAQGAHSLSG